mgnify:CR=1 FL=1
MSGNECDNNPSKLGGGVPGTSNGAGSPLDRFRLRNGFGQHLFLEKASLLKKNIRIDFIKNLLLNVISFIKFI